PYSADPAVSSTATMATSTMVAADMARNACFWHVSILRQSDLSRYLLHRSSAVEETSEARQKEIDMNQVAEQTMMPATHMNGLDLKQLNDTVDLLVAQPMLARFEFRASNRWMTGGENRSRIQGFYGAGQEDASRTAA